MNPDILIDRSDRILSLTIDRQIKKNALTHAMYRELAEQLEAAETDPWVRVVVLRAAGPLFTAGNDLSEFAELAAAFRDEPGEDSAGFDADTPVIRFLRALASATLPIVAAVQGRAVGIGTTLLLHCDAVVLAEDALLTTPFADLALVPEAGSSLLLPQRIGHARAFGMLVLGEAMDAPTALELGLATAVVPGAELQDQAQQIAQTLAAKPAGAVRASKGLMRDVPALLEQIEKEREVFARRLASPEAQEAFTAFAQRRAPDFTAFD